MTKEAVSLTLATENLLWLRAQAHSSGVRSLSALVDQLVTNARTQGQVHDSSVRSVVGTVRIDPSDPELRTADKAVRELFPVQWVAEEPATFEARRRPTRRRR